jgi:hypothetical protein
MSIQSAIQRTDEQGNDEIRNDEIRTNRMIDGRHDFQDQKRSVITPADTIHALSGAYGIYGRISKTTQNPNTNITKEIKSGPNVLHEIINYTSPLKNNEFFEAYSNITIKSASFFSKGIPVEYTTKAPYTCNYYVTDDEKWEEKIKKQLKRGIDHCLYRIHVGHKDVLKNTFFGSEIRDKITNLFELNKANYTIDATHITKDDILKPMFGGKKSKFIYGDGLDPSSVNNEQLVLLGNDKDNNPISMDLVFCYLKGGQDRIDLTIIPDTYSGSDSDDVRFIFSRHKYNKTTYEPLKPPREADTTYIIDRKNVPSVMDISIYITSNLFEKKFNIFTSCLKHKKRIQPINNHDIITNNIEEVIKAVNSLFKNDLNNMNKITIAMSLKTIGDQIRLLDAKMLTDKLKTPCYCITLDKFLFDYGLTSRDCYMIGDSGTREDFIIEIYQPKSTNKNTREVIFEILQEFDEDTKKDLNVIGITIDQFKQIPIDYYKILKRKVLYIEQERQFSIEVEKYKKNFNRILNTSIKWFDDKTYASIIDIEWHTWLKKKKAVINKSLNNHLEVLQTITKRGEWKEKEIKLMVLSINGEWVETSEEYKVKYFISVIKNIYVLQKIIETTTIITDLDAYKKDTIEKATSLLETLNEIGKSISIMSKDVLLYPGKLLEQDELENIIKILLSLQSETKVYINRGYLDIENIYIRKMLGGFKILKEIEIILGSGMILGGNVKRKREDNKSATITATTNTETSSKNVYTTKESTRTYKKSKLLIKSKSANSLLQQTFEIFNEMRLQIISPNLDPYEFNILNECFLLSANLVINELNDDNIDNNMLTTEQLFNGLENWYFDLDSNNNIIYNLPIYEIKPKITLRTSTQMEFGGGKKTKNNKKQKNKRTKKKQNKNKTKKAESKK